MAEFLPFSFNTRSTCPSVSPASKKLHKKWQIWYYIFIKIAERSDQTQMQSQMLIHQSFKPLKHTNVSTVVHLTLWNTKMTLIFRQKCK